MGGLMVKEPKYFPIKVPFRQAPDFSDFGTDWGNGVKDRHLFQLDNLYSFYRQEKLRIRSDKEKYILQTADFPEIEAQIIDFMAKRLAQEHPEKFSYQTNGFSRTFTSYLNDEEFLFDQQFRLIEQKGGVSYTSALDALVNQVQEDIAVLRVSDEKDWLSYLHISFPNRWDPREKIGRSFEQAHRPVADMQATNAQAPRILEVLLRKNRSIGRFAWGLHPVPVLDEHPAKGDYEFDPHGNLYLRVERQSFIPFPDIKAFFFAIRTYFYDCKELPRSEKEQLIASLHSMTPATRAYKLLSEDMVTWLQNNLY